MKKRWISLALAACLLLQTAPMTALAGDNTSDPVQLYTQQEIDALLNRARSGDEGDAFSFPVGGYALRRTEAGLRLPVLRCGPCEDEAEVILTARDVNATYGKDYVLEVDGRTLETRENGMQMVPTEDKHDPGGIWMTETNLLGGAAETSEDENVPPQTAPDAAQEGQGDVQAGKSPLRSLKEELFGRELSQTDSFYGNSRTEAGASGEDTAQPLAQALASGLDGLWSAQTALRFGAGEQYKLITIKVLPEGTSAGDESFRLSLSPGTDGTSLGEYAALDVSLKHEGELEQSVIGFADGEISAQGNRAEVTVTREKGEYHAAVVSFTTSAGTLEPGTDYSPVSKTLMFMPGETEKTISIPVNAAQSGTFSCLLSNPQGASLGREKTTVNVERPMTTAVYASDDPLKELHSYGEFSPYARHNSNMWCADGYYNIENTWRDHYHERGNYGIAQLGKTISGAAYSKVTLHFDSHAEFKHAWDAWAYSWNSREASTVFTALWRKGSAPYALDTGWNANFESSVLSNNAGYYSGWQHTGDLPRWSAGHTQSIEIPNNCGGDLFTYTVQHQHIKPWLARGSVHIKSVELTRRLLRFQYLPHEAFHRRLGSLTNTREVTNIFQLVPTAGRGQNSTYVIGDTVGYKVESAAQDKLYEYMTSLCRYGVRDSISANATGRDGLTLKTNYGFDLTDRFFEEYGTAFAQDGSGSTGKVAYIKPAYDQETWKADLTLTQTPDGTAELGFLDAQGNVAPLSRHPAYLSEEVTLRMTPKPGLYAKGYRVEYQDYDGVTRYETHELSESELNGYQGKPHDIRIPVRYSKMKLTPIYTSLPARKITVTVDPATRQYGVSFPEGVQEALLDAQGNRVAELEMGAQITEYAGAKSGYVPVWTRDGVRYSGETYDFVLGANDVDVRIGLSFQKAGVVTHNITGTVREPDVNINNILATDFGKQARKRPLSGATVASGLASAATDGRGSFTLRNTASVAGTRRTVRILRGGECLIREVDVPASGGVDMGTVDLPLAAGLPYKVSGTISYVKTDAQGNLNTYTSRFGGIGQDNSNLFRYDTAREDVNGSVQWLGNNGVYTQCEVIFTDKEGVEVSRVRGEQDAAGDFTFRFHPVEDARAGGKVYLSLRDKNGRFYGPYDTGIVVSDPPSGDIELMEGPSFTIPTKDVELPIVKMAKPNISSGLFSGTFDQKGLTIVVGFDVKKIVDEAKKQEEKKSNKDKADGIAKEAEKENNASTKPKAKQTTGKATASIQDLTFAATMSFAWFDKDGKVLARQEEGSILALYNVLFYVGVSGKAKGEINTSIYGVPVYVEISGKASVAVIASISAEDGDGKKTHFPLTAFCDTPTDLRVEGLSPISLGLGLEAGVGVKNMAAVYLDGSMDMDFQWHLWDTGTGTVTFAAGGGVYIFGQKLGFHYKFEPIQMFDTTKTGGPAAWAGEEPVKEAVKGAPGSSLRLSQTAMGVGQGQEATLLEGVLHDTHPRIADIGDGKTMVVFLADASDRTGVNRTGLYYAIYDGTSVTPPVLIDQDGTLDAAPDVMDLGSKVLIVWSDARRNDFGDTADVRDIMASMDISGVFYDKRSGSLGQKFSVTSDSQGTNDTFYLSADSQPAICYNEANGRVGVYYLKEDFGLLDTDGEETVTDFMNGQTTAAFCPIDVNAEAVLPEYGPDENVPERFQTALNGQRLLDLGISTPDGALSDPKIESFAVGSAGNYTVFAYPLDLDQSGATTHDQALFAVLIDQTTGRRYAPVRLTEGSAALHSLRFVKREVTAGNVTDRMDRLVWQEDGKLLCCDMDELLHCVTLHGDGSCTLGEDFHVAAFTCESGEEQTNGNEALYAAGPDGGTYAVTTRSDGGNSEIFVRYRPGVYTAETSEASSEPVGDTAASMPYLAGHGQWSAAVQVTQTANQDARRHILLKDAAAASDGSLLILCDSFEGVADTGALQLIRVTPSAALAPELRVASDTARPRAGDTVLLTAGVESVGLLDSDHVEVEFTLEDGRGNSTPIGSWTGDVPAGGRAQAVTEWIVPDGLTTGSKIVASASGARGELTDMVGEAVAMDGLSYRYLSTGDSQSELAVSAALLNQGNQTPEEVTLQICSVDQDIFHTEWSDGDAAGNAYTVLASEKITEPFAHGDHVSKEYPITLPESADGMPRELMVRVLASSGEAYDHGTEYISVMPPADEVEYQARPGGKPSGGASGSAPTTTTVTGPDGSTTTTTKHPDGTIVTRKTAPSGTTQTKVEVSPKAVQEAQEDGKAVTLPIPAVTATRERETAPGVEIQLPERSGEVKIEIPVTDVTPGTVVLLVDAGGRETVVRKTILTKDGVAFTLDESAAVKVVDNSRDFSDVKQTDWYSHGVAFVSARGLLNGVGGGAFAPTGAMTRGMLAAALYRMEDEPDTPQSPFHDVSGSRYDAKAVAWAAEKGIAAGYGNGQFGPDDPITREQLAVMLWRYAGCPAGAGDASDFADTGEISPWAVDAMQWAVERGIVRGKGDGRLDPQGKATRAEAAAMLMRLLRA